MEARGEYGKSKRYGGALLEGNGQAAKGKEENDTKEGVRSRRFFRMMRDIAEVWLISDQGILFLQEVS